MVNVITKHFTIHENETTVKRRRRLFSPFVSVGAYISFKLFFYIPFLKLQTQACVTGFVCVCLPNSRGFKKVANQNNATEWHLPPPPFMTGR